MSNAKIERNNEIIRMREKDKLTFLRISQLMNITEFAVRQIYWREVRRRDAKEK